MDYLLSHYDLNSNIDDMNTQENNTKKIYEEIREIEPLYFINIESNLKFCFEKDLNNELLFDDYKNITESKIYYSNHNTYLSCVDIYIAKYLSYMCCLDSFNFIYECYPDTKLNKIMIILSYVRFYNSQNLKYYNRWKKKVENLLLFFNNFMLYRNISKITIDQK